ncbi:MAG: NAD-dependent epimerase/dehydratase family protein [Acidimicrobiia bacterium]
MKIFIAGATGVVGRRAIKILVAGGDQVTAMARNPDKASLVKEIGAIPTSVDLFDPDSVRHSLVGQEVVINLATKIPTLFRSAVPGAWRENDRIRTIVSRNLVGAALESGAERYVQESFAPAYPDMGVNWIDETVPLSPAPYCRSILDAEGQAERFARAGGIGIVLRFGLFYGPDGSHAETILRLGRRGFSSVIGSPESFISLITTDDAATAVAAAVHAPAGIYNVSDDEPITREEFVTAFAQAFDLPRIRTLPAWMARIGGSKARMLMRSQRVSNERLKGTTGWNPAYKNANEGWNRIASQLAGR